MAVDSLLNSVVELTQGGSTTNQVLPPVPRQRTLTGITAGADHMVFAPDGVFESKDGRTAAWYNSPPYANIEFVVELDPVWAMGALIAKGYMWSLTCAESGVLRITLGYAGNVELSDLVVPTTGKLYVSIRLLKDDSYDLLDFFIDVQPEAGTRRTWVRQGTLSSSILMFTWVSFGRWADVVLGAQAHDVKVAAPAGVASASWVIATQGYGAAYSAARSTYSESYPYIIGVSYTPPDNPNNIREDNYWRTLGAQAFDNGVALGPPVVVSLSLPKNSMTRFQASTVLLQQLAALLPGAVVTTDTWGDPPVTLHVMETTESGYQRPTAETYQYTQINERAILGLPHLTSPTQTWVVRGRENYLNDSPVTDWAQMYGKTVTPGVYGSGTGSRTVTRLTVNKYTSDPCTLLLASVTYPMTSIAIGGDLHTALTTNWPNTTATALNANTTVFNLPLIWVGPLLTPLTLPNVYITSSPVSAIDKLYALRVTEAAREADAAFPALPWSNEGIPPVIPSTIGPTIWDTAYDTSFNYGAGGRIARTWNGFADGFARTYVSMEDGLWYFEVSVPDGGTFGSHMIGAGSPGAAMDGMFPGGTATDCTAYYISSNGVYTNSLTPDYPATAVDATTVVGVLIDATNRTVAWKGATITSPAYAIPGTGPIYGVFGSAASGVGDVQAKINAGQEAFALGLPVGYTPLEGVVVIPGDNAIIPPNVLLAVSANSGYLADQSKYGLMPRKIGANVTVPDTGSRTGDGYIANTDGSSGVDARVVYSTTDAWRTAWATATAMTFEYDVYNNQLDFAGGQFMNIENGHDAQIWPGGTVWALQSGVLIVGGGGPSVTLNHDTWYHIAHVADGVARELRVYVNGVLTATSAGISTGGFNWEAYPFSANNIGLLQLYSGNPNGSLNGGIDNIVLTAAAKYSADFPPPLNFAEAVGALAAPTAIGDVAGAGYIFLDAFTCASTGNAQDYFPDAYGTSNTTLDDAEAAYTAYVDAADITGTGTTTLGAFTNSGAGAAAIPTDITADYTFDDFTSAADGVADLPLEVTADYTFEDIVSISVGLFLAPAEGSGDSVLDDFAVTAFTASIITPPSAQATFSLPALRATASGTPTVFDGALLTLPALTAAAQGGHYSEFSLPMITAEATGTTIAMARAIMTIPMVEVEASGRVSGQSSVQARLPSIEVTSFGGHQAEITLPEITATATATVGSAAQAEFSLPRITVTAHGYRDDTARADITLPMLVMTPSAVATVDLPAFTVLAHGQPVLTNAYEAYVLNMNQPLDDNPRNNFEAKVEQVTRYTNWPFIQVVRLGSTYYGVAEDGLYELGGTTDNGTEITWSFETCKTDFDDPHKKAVASAYIGGQAGATVDYTLRSGDDVDHMYGYVTTKVIQKRNHRQKFGLGRRVRYYSFGLAGSGKAAIDTLEFELLNTTRRI